jgi:hypothetical protein
VNIRRKNQADTRITSKEFHGCNSRKELVGPEAFRLPIVHVGVAARLWHGVTLSLAAAAVIYQLVRVFFGVPVLIEEEPPGLAERVVRLFSYFTIQSNLLVTAAAATLVRNPRRDGPGWRVLRLDSLIGITVTGIVHWIFLRPLVDLSGMAYASDKVLHVFVPLLAVGGWLLFGPRPRIGLRVIVLGLIWPAVWLAYTLVRGAFTGWFPYPFLDLDVQGSGSVALAALGVTALLLALSLVFWLGDRRLPVASRR